VAEGKGDGPSMTLEVIACPEEWGGRRIGWGLRSRPGEPSIWLEKGGEITQHQSIGFVKKDLPEPAESQVGFYNSSQEEPMTPFLAVGNADLSAVGSIGVAATMITREDNPRAFCGCANFCRGGDCGFCKGGGAGQEGCGERGDARRSPNNLIGMG